jgi:hypothetical protein
MTELWGQGGIVRLPVDFAQVARSLDMHADKIAIHYQTTIQTARNWLDMPKVPK